MAKLENARDLKSLGACLLAGSIPALGTKILIHKEEMIDDRRYKASRILYESGEFSIFEANAMLETPNLRDKFAMSIITGLVSGRKGPIEKESHYVKLSYKLADKMLIERQKYED